MAFSVPSCNLQMQLSLRAVALKLVGAPAQSVPERDEFIIAPWLIVLSMIFSENRCPLFRIML